MTTSNPTDPAPDAMGGSNEGQRYRRAPDADGLRTNEHVFRALKDRIVTGDLAPGSRLIESGVAAQFGVSRTPVREALQRLAMEGLIDVDPIRGMVVHAPDAREIQDVLLIRASLDALAADVAARTATESDLARLRVTIEAMANGIAGDRREQIMLANRRFHDIIYEAASNPRLARMAGELRDYVRRFSIPPSASTDRVRDVLTEHRAILEALEQRDGDAARAASDRHLSAARAYVSRLALQEFAEQGLR